VPLLDRWLDNLGSGHLLGLNVELRECLVNGADLSGLGQLFLGHTYGVAVERGIGEQTRRRARVVDDVEPELPVVVADTGAAPDDLLELAHRAHHAGEHDVLAGGHVHARGEQLRRGHDRRHQRVHVLEPAEVAPADLALVGGDAADVVRVLPHQVRVEVGESRAHLAGVLLVHAEHDGLGEAVGLPEEVGQVLSDRSRAGSQGDDAFEVLRLVLVVGNGPPVAVPVDHAGPPAGRIPFGDHTVDAVGSEEAVVDALPQAVLVDRVAEVEIGIAVVVTQRRGRHPELERRLEVLENGTP
jgi:hypothetical protein